MFGIGLNWKWIAHSESVGAGPHQCMKSTAGMFGNPASQLPVLLVSMAGKSCLQRRFFGRGAICGNITWKVCAGGARVDSIPLHKYRIRFSRKAWQRCRSAAQHSSTKLWTQGRQPRLWQVSAGHDVGVYVRGCHEQSCRLLAKVALEHWISASLKLVVGATSCESLEPMELDSMSWPQSLNLLTAMATGAPTVLACI